MKFLNKAKNFKGISFSSKILFLLVLFLPLVKANIFEKTLEVCDIPRKILVEDADNFLSLRRGEFTTTVRTSPKQQISCDTEIKKCPDFMKCHWYKGTIPGTKQSNIKCITYVGKNIIDFNRLLVKYKFRFEGCEKGSTTCYNEGTIYVHISKDKNPISRTDFLLVFLFIVLFIIVLNSLTDGFIVDILIGYFCIELLCKNFREPDIFTHINSSFTGSD